MKQKNTESQFQKCRTCYQNIGIVPIGNTMLITKVTVGDMIKRCIPIQVNNLKETHVVCTSCLTILINFYKFQDKCITVDKLFRKGVNCTANVIIKLDEDGVECHPNGEEYENVNISNSSTVEHIKSTSLLSDPFTINDVGIIEEIYENNPDTESGPCKNVSNGSNVIPEKNFHCVNVGDKYLIKIPKISTNKTEKQIKKYYKLKLDDGTLTEIGDSLTTLETNKPIFRVKLDEKNNSSVVTPTPAINDSTNTRSMVLDHEVEAINAIKLRFPKLYNIPCPCDLTEKTKQLRPSTSYAAKSTLVGLSSGTNSLFEMGEINLLKTTTSCATDLKQNITETFTAICRKFDLYTTNSTIPTWISDHNYRPISKQERKQFYRDLRRYKKNIKHKNWLYQCIICLNFFKNFNLLLSHRRQEHKSGPFVCLLCNTEYTHVKLMERHQRYHAKRPLIDKCNVCDAEFEDEEFFKEHLKIHPNFICETCGKIFNHKNAFKTHTRMVHSNKYQCMCNICGLILKSNKNLNEHIQAIHEAPNTRDYKCDECGKEYKTLRVLSKHKRYTHSKYEKISCEKCGKLFTNLKTLSTHIKLVHDKVKPFKCEFCDSTFGRNDYLKSHTKTHFSDGLKRRRGRKLSNVQLTCKLCKKLCPSLSQLKAHMKLHYPLRKHQCTVCHLTFVNKANLSRHSLIHRDGSKRFRCKICFRSFRSQEELEEHEMTHTNFKYECDVCSEKFARKYLMENHKTIYHINLQQVETEIEENIQVFLEQCVLSEIEPVIE